MSLVFIPNHIAPGVYIQVVPKVYGRAEHPHKYNALFFIAADKGPANQLVFITSQEQFVNTFGIPPVNYPLTGLYAYYWSRFANALCIRLLPKDATKGHIAFAFVPYVLTIGSDTYNTYTIAAGYLNPDETQFTVAASFISDLIGQTFDVGELTVTYNFGDLKCFPFAIFYGYGEYYNSLSLFMEPGGEMHLINLQIRQGNTVLFAGQNVSFEPNTTSDGYRTELSTQRLNNVVEYEFRNLVFETVIKGNLNIVGGYYLYFRRKPSLTDPVESQLITPNDDTVINSADIMYTVNDSTIEFQGGSNGSLGSGRDFNHEKFYEMVRDAIYGRSVATGYPTSLLAEPIYALLDETYPFVKYIFDPTDRRVVADETAITSTQGALMDYALKKWFANQGAIVLANVYPIHNVFDVDEVYNKQFFNSHLVAAYVSLIKGNLLHGVREYPQLAFVAKDLVELRAAKFSVQPFAGVINASHSGAIDVVRKFTLAERNQLVLNGINFAVRDIDYGVYTDLDRTTVRTGTMLRWLYVVEDLVDMKYEVQKLLKQYLHLLQTYDWDFVKRQIEELILQPRLEQGLITEYSVELVMDERYLNQNVLPVIISVKYAREIERIAVTIYVQ